MPPKSKQANTNTAVVVALIGLVGTLITALFTSPVLIELIKRSDPTQTPGAATPGTTPDATLVFDEDFEDGVASGFAFQTGDWKIGKDKNNSILEFIATGPEAPAATAYFGPSSFSDGVVEFRVKFIELHGFYFDFRQQNDAVYVLSLDPDSSVIVWAVNATEAFYEISSDTIQPFTFVRNVWYSVRVEARGEKVTVTVDGNRIMSDSDTRLDSGSIRFALQPNAVVYIDDVKVWSYDH